MTEPPVDPKLHSWDETIRTLIVALLLAVTFRSLAYEPFHIPSGSMKSTLLVGDYLFVSKYAYGYSRFSFPIGLPIFSGRILESHKPQRGDVVVFRYPGDTRIDFIKRIIGLPGDSIQVKDGRLYINGTELKEQQVDNFADIDAPDHSVHSIPRFAETLPGGKVIDILKDPRPVMPGGFDPNNTGVYHVPPDHYFMMGDNRDNSTDSRFPQVSYVPAENLVGQAEFLFFSTDGTAEWSNVASWFKAMRFDRFFTRIE